MKHVICALIDFRLPALWQYGVCEENGLVTYRIKEPSIEFITRYIFNTKTVNIGAIRPLGI